MTDYRKDDVGETAGRVAFGFIVVAIIPLLMTIVWGALHLIASGTRYPADFDRWEMRNFFVEGWNFFGGTPWLWAFIAISVIAFALCLGVEGSDGEIFSAGVITLVGLTTCAIFGLQGVVSFDKVPAQFYNQATSYYVKDVGDVPAAITRLVENGKKDTDGCAVKPVHDVPGCVMQGTLPYKPGLWQGRTSSFSGAKTVLASSTANQQGANLMDSSLTYLGGETEETEQWTGIIDGSGAYNSAKGVVAWAGKTGSITKCLFGDKHTGTTGYRFNRAFDGAKKNSLSHLILSTYPSKFYDDGDVWGYCEGNKPVYVVPMKKLKPFHHQMVEVPAGTLIIKGSSSGDPVLDLRKDIKEGDLHGPVVPASIVAKQREALDWSAGRKYRKSSGGNNGGFGFDVATTETQAGNDSEYRLYNTEDKRWYYVTLLTPNDASSQTFTAIALTPTDSVSADRLPPMNVYVLEDDQGQQANADRLHSDALNYIAVTEPGFSTNKGELTELTPLGGDMYRFFAQVKGYTTHYIDLSITGRVAPRTVKLNNVSVPGVAVTTPGQTPTPGQSQGPGTPAKVCEKPVAQMTVVEKTACIKALADSLATAPR